MTDTPQRFFHAALPSITLPRLTLPPNTTYIIIIMSVDRATNGEQASMEQESKDTIVGVNAPIDLSGRTPVAWSVKSQRRNRAVSERACGERKRSRLYIKRHLERGVCARVC